MRQYFFVGMILLGVVAGITYFLWTIISSLYRSWDATRDIDQIRTAAEARRRQKELDNAQRLDNGCEHVFDSALSGFPPHACRKCGLERDKPAGTCDHIWRPAKESVPCSYCEKCGKKYTSAVAHQGWA